MDFSQVDFTNIIMILAVIAFGVLLFFLLGMALKVLFRLAAVMAAMIMIMTVLMYFNLIPPQTLGLEQPIQILRDLIGTP